MNQSQDYSSLGQQRIPSPSNYTDWMPREFNDDNFFLDSTLDQPLNLTPEEERLFRSFGDGLDSGLGSMESSSEPLDERQVVYAEAQAAGLFKGGIRRAAFSMGDLQALQPPELPALVPSLQSQGSRPPLPSVGSSKPPRLESVPESKALPSSSSMFGGELMMGSRLSGLSAGGLSDGQIDNNTLDQLSAELAADLQSSFDLQDVPMPLFGEQQRQGLGVSSGPSPPPLVKSEPGETMLGMYPPGSSTSFPSTSSGPAMYDYSFLNDSRRLGMMPNKVEEYGGQSYSSDSAMDLRGFADQLLAPTRPPQPQGKERAGIAERDGGGDPREAEKEREKEREREKEQQRQRMLRRSRSAVELRSMGGGLARHGSTPDLQQHSTPRTPGLVELTNPEGQTYTAGRLSNEERAQKILRYRQKRHERNFNKRIKYMCRKTLADSRPRVRGRFARNDDTAAVMPHETKKALAEKARKEKKAKAEAAKAASAAQNSQQGYWGDGAGSAMLTGQHLPPGGSYPAMIPNSNSGIFGGDYYSSTNSSSFNFPSLP